MLLFIYLFIFYLLIFIFFRKVDDIYFSLDADFEWLQYKKKNFV